LNVNDSLVVMLYKVMRIIDKSVESNEIFYVYVYFSYGMAPSV